MRKFIIDTHGPDPDGFVQAFSLAEVLYNDNAWNNILLISAVQNMIKKMNYLMWPENDERKALFAGKNVQTPFGAILRYSGMKGINSFQNIDIIIAAHISIPNVDKIIKNNNCHALIFIPWTINEKDKFIENHCPENINDIP